MTTKTSVEQDPLTALLAMPLGQRIIAVAEDVQSRTDRFSGIDEFDLAEALEVSQPEMPTSDDWSFTSYADRQTLEEYVTDYGGDVSEVLECLESTVGVRRFRILEKAFALLEDATSPSFDFLTAKEREYAEERMARRRLEANLSNGMSCIASTSVSQGDVLLAFEADIEDDGTCISLRTPYDERDGRFRDLSHCITDDS